ncbi:uncharacterized protein LOC110714176 [Chenopodium quinoa]|uniref:uncharacterized protein LOC110714176 n=1 Tax=Chenopodium quinoa TaxID=63459 RepID=UPI000B7726D4|nr:uncharacterized protein LOC110714176 [Chenopodium quinoa]
MGNCACAIKDYYTNTTTSTPVYHHRRQRRLEAEATKTTEQKTMIKVVTTTGGIMELYSPITVEQITSEFPNHGIFLNPNPASNPPMLHNDNLCPGQLYYLLPLNLPSSVATETDTSNYNVSTPYRMSVDTTGTRVVYKNQPDTDVVPRNDNGSGVWKVRLVINPEHLSEILSQDNKTQQLIESVRTVAKCGSGNATNGGAKTSSSLSLSSSAGSSSTPNNSDQCSVSS